MSNRSGYRCAFKNCNSVTSGKIGSKETLFRFPKDAARCKLWVEACNRKELNEKSPATLYNNYRLCTKHFSNKMFLNFEKTRLQPHAVPFASLANVDTDSLAVSSANNLSLIDNYFDNIEFVIEDNNDTGPAETKLNPIVIKVADLKEGNSQQSTTDKVLPVKEAGNSSIIDLDLPCTIDDIKDEEILEIGETKVQPQQEQTKINQKPIAYEKTVDVDQDTTSKNGVCYVPECTFNLQNKVYWFGVPLDDNLKEIWDICIDHKDRRLSAQDVICSKHFSKEDIMFWVTTSSKDGLQASSCSRPRLREGAVPCIKFHEECCVPTCRRKCGKQYCFPVIRTSDFHLWLYMIKNPALKNLKMKDVLRHRVCELHFEYDCFDDDNELSLKRTAAPTLNLPESYSLNLASLQPVPVGELLNIAQKNVSLACAYVKCVSRDSKGKNLFNFPTDPDRCIAWLKACGRKDLITSPFTTVQRLKSQRLGVCEDHFDFHHFEVTRDKLEPNAIPKSYLKASTDFKEFQVLPAQENKKPSSPSTVPNILRKPTDIKETIVKTSNPNIGLPAFSGICFYKGCHSQPSEKNQFFNFPAESQRYKAWLKACGRLNLSAPVNKKLSKSQRICNKHFEKEMFESENKLKSDAVPTIYNNMLGQLNKGKDAGDSSIAESNTDGTKQKEENNPQQKTERLNCAVENCLYNFNVPNGTEICHRFPNPAEELQRFDIWLKLLANKKLSELSNDEVYTKYMVCAKHFDLHFYENGVKSNHLSLDAVPTVKLTANICWFFDTDYYKSRVQNYFNKAFEEDLPEGTIEWRKDDAVNIDFPENIDLRKNGTVNKESCYDKTQCILEKDRIRFPGMGHYLYLGKSQNEKRKFPYAVYKHFKSGYGLNTDIEVGESVSIRTAIIIDDDDDCERAVLQQLLDIRKKN